MPLSARARYLINKVQGEHVGEELSGLLETELLVADGGTGSAASTVSVDPKTSVGVGAVAGTGNTVAEYGNGTVHKTVITLTNTAIAMADDAGVVAYGGMKIYDFPVGAIMILGALGDLAITKSSAGVNDTWDGDIALGTAAATTGATLISTEADIVPSTATPQAADGATTGDFGGVISITALTDSSAGTANDTVQALSDGSTYANDVAAIRNNFADLAAKVNEILTRSIGAGPKVFNGTSTAKDCYLNVLVDDADHDVTGTACNLIFNGTITLTWVNLGDY